MSVRIAVGGARVATAALRAMQHCTHLLVDRTLEQLVCSEIGPLARHRIARVRVLPSGFNEGAVHLLHARVTSASRALDCRARRSNFVAAQDARIA
jgi:hypothetical protein